MTNTLTENTQPLTKAGPFVSITFDDGLYKGNRLAASILNEYGIKATFFVVTGWVGTRFRWRIRDPWNRDRSHGTWDGWRQIATEGHEIGSHTHNHFNARGRLASRFPQLVRYEISRSREILARRLDQSPLTISMPWNSASAVSAKLVQAHYDACRLGGAEFQVNDLGDIDWYRLRSWAPDSDVPISHMEDRLSELQPGEWLIFQFHSLDDEGYMPIERTKFEHLCRAIAENPHLSTTTIGTLRNPCETPGVEKHLKPAF